MASSLFHEYDLRRTIDNHRQALDNEVNSLSENEVLNTSQEDMVKYLVGKYRLDVPKIDEECITTDYGDTKIDVSQDFRRVIFNRDRPFHIAGTRITFYVPFTGDPDLFKCQPSTWILSGTPAATVGRDRLTFIYDMTQEYLDRVGEKFDQDLTKTQQYLGYVAADVAPFNSELAANAASKINSRREKLLRDREIVANLRFPLQRRQDSPTTFVTPDIKRRITPRKPKVSSETFNPEPTLAMEDYEHILSVLTNMVVVMEQSPRAFKDMGEEDLRTHFLVQLNGQYEGQATGETFNYEGKTDILIKADGRNIFIAECKFWTGPAGLTQALDQLLGYASWRDTKVALVVFNRDRSLSTVLKRIPSTVQNHPSYKSEGQAKSETDFRYTFGHRDDSNREITVSILVFDVPA